MKIKYLLPLIIAASTAIYAQKKQSIRFKVIDKTQISLNCSAYKNKIQQKIKIQVTKNSDDFYISLTRKIEDHDKTFLASIMAIKTAIKPETLKTINDICELEDNINADENIIEKAKGFKINYISNIQKNPENKNSRNKRSTGTTTLNRKFIIEFTNLDTNEAETSIDYQNPKMTIRVNTIMVLDEYMLLLNKTIEKLKKIENHEKIYHMLMSAIYAANPDNEYLRQDVQTLFWEESKEYDKKHYDLYKDIEHLVQIHIIDSYSIRIKDKEGTRMHINKL